MGLLVLCACAKRVSSPEPVEDRAPPGWIRVKPDEPTRYQGVGYTVQTPDPLADRVTAANKAREDLLHDIQSRLKARISRGEASSEMWPRVNWTDLEKALEPLQPIDLYSESIRRRTWAFMVLDQDELDRMLAKRRASLEPRARKHLAAAAEAQQSGRPVDALREQTAALYLASGPEGFYMAGSQPGTLLRTEIEAGLSRMVQMLEVQRVAGPDHARAAGLRDARLVVQVAERDSGQPVAKMPVAFRFARGAGDVAPTGTTDGDGRVSAALRSLDPRVSPVEIEATLNLQALLTGLRLPPLPDAALDYLQLPRATFSLAIDPPRLLLSQIERGGTGGGRGQVKTNEFAEAFRKQGLTVVDSSVSMLVNPEVFQRLELGRDPGAVEGADMLGLVVVSLNRIRREKGRYQDILYGEGEASFRLYDLERHALLMDIRLPQEVSGFSQGDIERNFFLQSQDELRDKVLDQLADESFIR